MVAKRLLLFVQHIIAKFENNYGLTYIKSKFENNYGLTYIKSKLSPKLMIKDKIQVLITKKECTLGGGRTHDLGFIRPTL